MPLGRRAVVSAPRRRHEDPAAPLGLGWGQSGHRIPQVGVGVPCSVPGVYYRVRQVAQGLRRASIEGATGGWDGWWGVITSVVHIWDITVVNLAFLKKKDL